MALFNKRFASFGREDRLVGVRGMLKGESYLIRIAAFVLLAGLFYLFVELTHKKPRASEVPTEQADPPEKQPSTK